MALDERPALSAFHAPHVQPGREQPLRCPGSLSSVCRSAIRITGPVPQKRVTGLRNRRSLPSNRGPTLGAPDLVEGKMPTIIDVNAEAAKLTMFRGKTPKTTRAERKGSSTQLGVYRDGLLLLGKSAGTSHWETHPEDALVHVIDGTRTVEIVCADGPPKSFELRPG